jgi:hypothetical protein
MPQTVTIELTKPIAGRDSRRSHDAISFVEKIVSVTLRPPTLQELIEIGLGIKPQEFRDRGAQILAEHIDDLKEYLKQCIVAPPPSNLEAFDEKVDPVDLERLQDALAHLIVGVMTAGWRTPLPFRKG